MLMIREDVQIVTMKQREKKVITTIKEPSFSFTFSASFVLLFSRIFSLRPLSFFFHLVFIFSLPTRRRRINLALL